MSEQSASGHSTIPDPAAEPAGMKTAFDALRPLDREQRRRAIRWLAEALSVADILRPR